jgi:cytochrome P450
MEGWRQCGNVWRFAGPLPLNIVTDPDGVQHILEENAANYQHPPLFTRNLSVVMGEGIITTEGDNWMRRRRLIQPAFHKEAMPGFAAVMVESIGHLLDRWQALAERGEVIDVRREMTKLALTVLARGLFSVDWSTDADEIAGWIQTEISHVGARQRSPIPIPETIPLPSNKRFLEARERMDGYVFRHIAERRRTEPGNDLLAMLMQVRDADTGEGMTDRQIRDEITTLFIAGHDTTASALTWIFYLLSKNPAVRDRLRGEVTGVLGERMPTMEDVSNLPYNKWVIQEALRLYPPLWALPRMPIEDDEICGYRIPGGAFVLVVPFVTHRNPAYWENPEGFEPERFSPERSAGRPRYAYYPFAGGPRGCIGFPFTMLEMQLALAAIIQRYQLDLFPGFSISYQTDISLNPKSGLPMYIHPAPEPAVQA